MDRELNPEYVKKRIAKRLLAGGAVLAVTASVLIYGPGWIKPSIARSRIRTSRVEAGAVESTVTAAGTVVPEFEQVLSSPINARVVRILKRPGSLLVRGEPILELDVNESRLALEKFEHQVELKRNQQAQARLALEETLSRVRSQLEIKSLELKTARANTARNRELYQQGLLSEERLREIELVEERNRFELKQLEEARENAQQSTRTQLEGLALEMRSLEQERVEARRQLELATTKSDRDGVLTWVIEEEGATVPKGALLARIADLRSFRVEATVSDVHAPRLAAGMPVKVKVNEEFLDGRLERINPAINNGVMTIVVSLDDKSNTLLRSNLRVDVLVATERKDRVLRLKKGPFANAEGLRDVFVVRGDAAVKTPVKLGIASFDHYEVVAGLLEGDEVIISDLTAYQHARELKLK